MIDVPDISEREAIFGTTKALPAYAAIPDEFKRWTARRGWVALTSRWFFKGLPRDAVIVRDGLDKKKVIAALGAHLRSFEPKHEHKEAGVAYLMSQWLDPASLKILDVPPSAEDAP